MANDIEKIDIIIPNKSNMNDLFKCLDSLIKNVDVKKYKIETIIVDDFSKRNERSEFLNNLSKYESLNIHPIFFNKHYGFTQAINSGISYSLNKKSKPKYIAFLHNDTIVLKDWLENLIYQVENDVLTMGVGSVTLNYMESQCISKIYEKIDPTIDIQEYYDATPENMDEVSLKIWKDNDKLEFTENNFNDKISLFSALFKIEAFQNFGLFDNDLIGPCKVENEFCQRLIDNGKKITIVPKSFVYHKCRQLSYETNPNVKSYVQFSEANMYNMELKYNFNKNVPVQKNYVIYTFVQEYGELPKIKNFDNDAEYVCFTTDERVYGNRTKTYPWKIFKVNEIVEALEFPKLDKKIKQFFQINPHLFFKNYNVSVYIDSNIVYDIEPSTQEYIRLMDPKHFILALNSCENDCSYRELIKQYKAGLMNKETFEEILQLFSWYRYPKNNGLIEPTIIIRKHNDERTKLVMNKWWNFIFKYKVSEKLLFNLAIWYFKYAYSYIPANLFYKKYVKLIEGK